MLARAFNNGTIVAYRNSCWRSTRIISGMVGIGGGVFLSPLLLFYTGLMRKNCGSCECVYYTQFNKWIIRTYLPCEFFIRTCASVCCGRIYRWNVGRKNRRDSIAIKNASTHTCRCITLCRNKNGFKIFIVRNNAYIIFDNQ